MAQDQEEDESMKREKLLKCVGLDGLLGRDYVAKSQEVAEAREHHRNVILHVQELQRTHNIFKPEDIVRMSMASSDAARARAYRIALIMGSL